MSGCLDDDRGASVRFLSLAASMTPRGVVEWSCRRLLDDGVLVAVVVQQRGEPSYAHSG